MSHRRDRVRAARLGVAGHLQPGGTGGVVVRGGLGVEQAGAGEQAAVPLGEGEDRVAAHGDPRDHGAVDPGGAERGGHGVGVGLQGRLGRSAHRRGDRVGAGEAPKPGASTVTTARSGSWATTSSHMRASNGNACSRTSGSPSSGP